MWALAASLFGRRQSTTTNAVRAAPGAALRAIARWPWLVPSDGSLESYRAYMAAIGEDADGIDWRGELAVLAGWPGVPPVPIVAAPVPPSVAKPQPPVTAPALIDVPRMPGRLQLSAERAAEAFLAWVRLTGRCGVYSNRSFEKLYREHCTADDIVPLADKTLRSELLIPGKYPGVTRALADIKGTPRRHRPTQWTIAELSTVVDDIPWSDLPERRAA